MNIPDKVTNDVYTAAEFTEFKNEIMNTLTSAGITPASSSLQLQQAIARYAANGASYTDSGAANAYVANPIGSNDHPSSHLDGMLVFFKAGNSNTGASTLTVSGLSSKSIKKGGYSSALSSGDIVTGSVYGAYFSVSDDAFELFTFSGGGGGGVDLGYSTAPTTGTVTKTGGTNAVIPAAVAGVSAGLLTGADKTILDGLSPNVAQAGFVITVAATVVTEEEKTNVTSIVRTGSGKYTITFPGAVFANIFYRGSYLVSEASTTTVLVLSEDSTVNRTVTVMKINIETNGGSSSDPQRLEMTFFGGQ